MKFLNRDSWLVSSLPVILPLLIISAIAWKTRDEIISRTEGVQRADTSRRAMELLNENNEIWMPRFEDIVEGRDPVRPMEKPVGSATAAGQQALVNEIRAVREQIASSSITTTWPRRDGTRAISTPFHVGESSDQWFDRHDLETDSAHKRKE